MPLSLHDGQIRDWHVKKIAVIGPGIVGMPMAALLAHAKIREGTTEPARVVVVQRNSPTSGWKVSAINSGHSPIGGVEPELDRIVAESVAAGLLSASTEYSAVRDADVILICVQTDKAGLAPDYGPLFEALAGVAEALRDKPAGNVPLIVFESTLAPSSMATLVRAHFARYDLVEGRDILLGNSPNRVMPGRLVERVRASDKLAGGLHPATPGMIARLYGRIVTEGTLLQTNSLTAEVVKTLENAYRDVRIAFSAEVARYCDAADIDFYALRERVNARLLQADGASSDPNAVPSGGLLIPTVGVGGHCLPKDGILLWWRALEAGVRSDRSLILEARRINDESPAYTLGLAERAFGPLAGRAVTILGAAYRFNSEDTRNSPTLVLAQLLLAAGAQVQLHDPYVKPDDQNLRKYGLTGVFTRDLKAALGRAEVVIVGTAHHDYLEQRASILQSAPRLVGLVDACNAYHASDITGAGIGCTGIGRGRQAPPDALLDTVTAAFRAMETGLANEVATLCEFLNVRYAQDDFGRIRFADVQRIAGTCVTGCVIADPGPVLAPPAGEGFGSRLTARAAGVGAPEPEALVATV
jgi:UDP-N-acetyl-D-mannosaminuronic acid dehydrogenase